MGQQDNSPSQQDGQKFGAELRDIDGNPLPEEIRQQYEDAVRTSGLARWRYNDKGQIIGAIITYPLADTPFEISL